MQKPNIFILMQIQKNAKVIVRILLNHCQKISIILTSSATPYLLKNIHAKNSRSDRLLRRDALY